MYNLYYYCYIIVQIIEIMDDLINFDRIDNVDNKIEKKFNKLMLELQTAVKAINRDEDEIRKATTKMKSSLSSLQRSVSKPNTSRSQVDEHLAEQVAILSEHISKKMDKDEALEYLTNKTDREELQRIITQLSMEYILLLLLIYSLRRSLNQTIEKALPAEDSNPWATKGVDSPSSEMYCLSCNRKRTMDKEKKPISTLGPGYQSLGGGFQVRLPEIRNKKVPQYDLLSSDDDEGSDASPLVGTDGKIYRGRSLDPGEFANSLESHSP